MRGLLAPLGAGAIAVCILAGWLAGWFAGVLPGVGAAQAGVIAAQVLRARTREFLSALGGINTSNILFTIIMFYAIGKTRSGAVWAISQLAGSLGLWDMILLVFVGITVAFVSAIITIYLGRVIISRMGGISYNMITISVTAFLVTAITILSGLPGLLAALVGTLIGLVSVLGGIKRSHLMGFLLLPTILYFSGLSPHVMLMLGI